MVTRIPIRRLQPIVPLDYNQLSSRAWRPADFQLLVATIVPGINSSRDLAYGLSFIQGHGVSIARDNKFRLSLNFCPAVDGGQHIYNVQVTTDHSAGFTATHWA